LASRAPGQQSLFTGHGRFWLAASDPALVSAQA
jgi:hypothetical protein